MKYLLICLLLSLSTIGIAQQSRLTVSRTSVLRTKISDDNHTLSIQIAGRQTGRLVHFGQTFDVSGKSSLQKELLKFRVFRSQGLLLPAREMPGLLATLLALVVCAITGLIVRYQARQIARTRSLLKT